MTRLSVQSPTVFSRDLKYMLDSRHAAASLRRPIPKRAAAAVFVVTMTIAAWAGLQSMRIDEDGVGDPVEHRDHSWPSPPDHGAERAKYTQPRLRVSKAIDATGFPASAPASVDRHRATVPVLEWKSYSVRRGDTLGGIFHRFSLGIALAAAVVQREAGVPLKKLLPGHRMRFGYDDSGALVQVRYELNKLEEIRLSFRDPDHFAVDKLEVPTRTRESTVSHTIGSSLFVSASRAGLSNRLIMQLVSIFGWDIDFALDIRSGDRFSVLYEEKLADGKPVGAGDIIAAEFFNNGTVYQAIRYIDDAGRKEYYDLDGNNVRGTFLRTPMRVSRVTSGFSKRRYHPILGKWRAHQGIDYGARTGTPVLATADGRVDSIGRNGGYGKTIVLSHGGRYSTLYAHLSGYRKDLSKGSKVSQGEVIGYVGSTGLATGPHLHYEFRVNGIHRDPLTYDMPKAAPIAERDRAAFLALARARISRIKEGDSDRLASR